MSRTLSIRGSEIPIPLGDNNEIVPDRSSRRAKPLWEETPSFRFDVSRRHSRASVRKGSQSYRRVWFSPWECSVKGDVGHDGIPVGRTMGTTTALSRQAVINGAVIKPAQERRGWWAPGGVEGWSVRCFDKAASWLHFSTLSSRAWSALSPARVPVNNFYFDFDLYTGLALSISQQTPWWLLFRLDESEIFYNRWILTGGHGARFDKMFNDCTRREAEILWYLVDIFLFLLTLIVRKTLIKSICYLLFLKCFFCIFLRIKESLFLNYIM